MEPSDTSVSRSPAKTPEPPACRTTLQLDPSHEESRDSLEVILPPDSTVGQFSFAPATQTTVVTTTTTTTTNFPPFVMRPPRCLRNLDPKSYPLASSPTPDSLKEICFTMDGQSVTFREPEDCQGALEQVRHSMPHVVNLSERAATNELSSSRTSTRR